MQTKQYKIIFVCLFELYGLSTFAGFLNAKSIFIQKKQFYFKQFSLA